MNAPGIWAGLGDSIFLAGIDERDRDPARIGATFAGGVCVGAVAALAGLLLVMIAYTLASGQGGRGLEGLGDVGRALQDPQALGVGLAIARTAGAVTIDGAFFVVFVAFAAVLAKRPLLAYVTGASQVRWRLLGLAMGVSLLALAPMVVAERVFAPPAGSLPFLDISPALGDRILYALASLLLIPAAAAEELFFRGWLLRQTAAFLRRPVMLIAVQAVLFSALHFDFSPDAFLTRTVMGAAFAYMTLRLGGIEFAAGVHAMNNMLIVLFLQPLGIDQPAGSEVSVFSLIETLAMLAGYVVITEAVARSAALRRLGGVQAGELSPLRHVSEHFS